MSRLFRDHTVPTGKASPCSRRTYFGQVKCMCWNIIRTSDRKTMSRMNRQKNRSRAASTRAEKKALFRAGAPASSGSVRSSNPRRSSRVARRPPTAKANPSPRMAA